MPSPTTQRNGKFHFNNILFAIIYLPISVITTSSIVEKVTNLLPAKAVNCRFSFGLRVHCTYTSTFASTALSFSKSQTSISFLPNMTAVVPPQQSVSTPIPDPPLSPLPDVLTPESQERHQAAADTIGTTLLSRASANFPRTGDARADFLTDHYHFMTEISSPFKLRRIGGAELDLYGLYRAVLERGGLQAVILTRAFKMVAKALQLPKTCTSAAFILRSEYEKLLYAYEQKHVWQRDPVNLPPVVQADRRRSLPIRPPVTRTASTPAPEPVPTTAPPAPPAAVHPLQKPLGRSRRAAAVAASNAVAAVVSDDPYAYPIFPRRGRLTGLDEHSLDTHEEQIVEDEIINDNAPHALYVPSQPSDKERVVNALYSPLHDNVAWALGTLNALSFDVRNLFAASEFPHVLEALHHVLNQHLEDVQRERHYGVAAGMEDVDRRAPRDAQLSAIDVRQTGLEGSGPGVGVGPKGLQDDALRNSSLQQYPKVFNLRDPVAVDREQCAVVAANILRNMSFFDRNAITLASSEPVLTISAVLMETAQVVGNLREGLMDMWINVSPYLDVSEDSAGHAVLDTCIQLLDPFKEGAELSRFTNSGEVLARLAASPERNEKAMVETFDTLLPRLVDMLGGRHRRYVNAALAALCNLSAFDWPARERIARVPRALERLVVMLGDAEMAPRAAVTLLNLSEAPNNRSVMMVHEKRLVEYAVTASPAADTVANVVFELSHD